MTIKASGRSALILATGLFVCFAGPSQAAAGADTAAAKSENATGVQKHGSRHSKSYAQRKSGQQALKSTTAKAATTDAVADDADNSSAIPPSVANANAQLAPAGTPAGNARAMSARANDILQTTEAQPAADSQVVVAADQLNDLDRALHEGQPPGATMALASAEAPPVAAAPPVMASSQESSTWDQTSLIGKIFIGFGALLTMASAARMFMA
jgi:hypothetical protein